jgi:hypothetical protein
MIRLRRKYQNTKWMILVHLLWMLQLTMVSFSSSSIDLSSSTTTTKIKSPNILVVSAWEWNDVINPIPEDQQQQIKYLTALEISEMRVRDIKRRLARTHGYSADELGRMLDKKELIGALQKEEYRIQRKYQDKYQRQVLFRTIITAIIAIVVVMGWPLWRHIIEVAAVNWVVYTDRKKLELSKCFEYKTMQGFVGVFLMSIVDGLQWWLTISVLLSWVTTSKYFFPMPSLAIRPGQFMGEKVANGPMGKYGMNIAPMAVRWAMGFVQGQLEKFTARALSKGYQHKKKQAREFESLEEKAARKAERKAAKRAAKEEAERQRQMNLEQEAQRRKEMAEQATQQLFGRRSEQQNGNDNHVQPSEEQQLKQHREMQPNHEIEDETEEELEAKRQFEADLEVLDDINDLD